MGNKLPSDIRYSALTAPEDHAHSDEDAHPAYTEEWIEKAIVLGQNPAGQELDWTMPRWQVQQEDLKDLVQYLKTLGSD